MTLTAMLLALLAGNQSSAPEQASSFGSEPEILDYLIQDVCVDSSNRSVAGDPAACDARRNVRIGERLPYIVTDLDRRSGVSLASFSSIPVRGTDGQTKVLVIKSLEGHYSPDYAFSFSGRRDAFDLIDLGHSPYASIVRTFDGGCFDQVFSRNGKSRSMRDRAGGWVLFPLDPTPSAWPQESSTLVPTYRSQISAAKATCADNHALGITFWTRPTAYTFESGKRLTAIRSDHFAAADVSQRENSFERFYFTREYGMTRWEAWRSVSACRTSFGPGSSRCNPATGDVELRGRCGTLKTAGQKVSGVERRGGQDWVRLDCRDFTNYVPLKRAQLPLSPEVARGGGLVDIDYAATVGR